MAIVAAAGSLEAARDGSIVNYDMLAPARRRDQGRPLGAAGGRRGALHQEPHERAQPELRAIAGAAAASGVGRSAGGLRAHRHAAYEPATRSVHAAAAGGSPVGRSFLSFAKRYCAAEETDYGWVTDGASNLEELTLQLHGVMLRRTKDQVLRCRRSSVPGDLSR